MVNRSQKTIQLSVVIPAYNEAKRIGPTLWSVLRYLKDKKITGEIIVVDDGSSDTTTRTTSRTSKTIKIIKHSKNHGKGDAVRTGILAARGKFVLMMDADGSIPITEFVKLWPYRISHNLVIGSRFLKGSRFRTASLRRMLISKFGNLIFRLIFRMPITDTQCGFKLFESQTAQPLFLALKDQGFLFDIEILVRAYKKGFSIKEVPINWHDTAGSKIRAANLALRSLGEVGRIYQTTRNL